MRKSICYCEPKTAIAGQVGLWRFVYTASVDLPKGASLLFDLLNKGFKEDWQIPDISLKKKNNVIWAQARKKIIPAKQGSKATQFLFILPFDLKAGEPFTIFMGTASKHMEEHGNKCQLNTQRKREFFLYIDPKGKTQYQEPEIFHIDVRGNILKNIKIITPSIVSKNKRFDILVRFEDEFGNLTSNAPEGTLIDLTYENLRDTLKWKLFVPETGFLSLPNLYFNEPGIYRINLKSSKGKLEFSSAPIKCFENFDFNLYWGTFHDVIEKFDANNIEMILRHFRDEKSLNFFSSSNWESEEETSQETWKNINLQIAEFNEDERFTAFCGFQWQGIAEEEGLRNFVYIRDNKPILRKKDVKSNNLKKIYKITQAKDLLSIPQLTTFAPCAYNFKDFNADFEKVVEIYSSFGSCECSVKEGNRMPIVKGKQEYAEGSIMKALINNCRFGFIAGGIDNRYKTLKPQYTAGLTAILAKEQTRDSFMEAICNRHCYATTGERIILGFNIAQEPMGSQLDTTKKPGLVYNRHISGFVIGTDDIDRVEIIRNGEKYKTFTPEGNSIEFEFDDMDALGKIVLKAQNGKPPFIFYYLRVLQKNGQMAWGSPIWIDMTLDLKKKSKAKT
jgi:hypothetical protein